MPYRRCRHFDQDTGDPIGLGCPQGSRCEFVHPRSPNWQDARPSRPVARPHRFSRRDRSDSVSPSRDSSRTSTRMPQQSQWPSSRHSEYQAPNRELGSRLSEPEPKSLSSRLIPPASPPSPPRESLSSRIRDPPQQTLTMRISEPPTSSRETPSVIGAASTWGSGHAKGWGEPGNDGFSWSDSPVQPAPLPPSRPPGQTPQTPRTSSREPSLSSALEPSMQQRDRQPSVSLSSSMSKQAPTLDRSSSRSAVQSRPVPPPQQPPSLPPLQPQPPQPPQPPSPQPPAPSLPLSVSPVQKTPTPSVSSAQMHPLEVSRPTNQRSTEAAESKNASIIVKQNSADAERVMDLCKASMQYIEYHNASEARDRERVRNQTSNNKHLHLGARQKFDSSLNEAENKANSERKKYRESVERISLSWPSAPPKDNRLEDANLQLQAIKQHVQQLEETLKGEEAPEKDSLTVEGIAACQAHLAERLEEIEEHQADVENSVEQRLDDLAQRHRDSYEELHSDALIEVKESATVSKLLQKRMDQLAKKHEAFAGQITQIYSRQADILHRSQKVHEENEALKKRLAIYEERDARFHSELQVAVQTIDMLKQQALNMQGRTDQLADSLKTIVMSQTREHIEEQFSMVKQEIGQHLKTTKEVFTKEFKGRYGPAINLLEQLTTHLRNAFNEPNQDATLN